MNWEEDKKKKKTEKKPKASQQSSKEKARQASVAQAMGTPSGTTENLSYSKKHAHIGDSY